MRFLVCGGRDFADYDFLAQTLSDAVAEFVSQGEQALIIEGGARGADKLARQWAEKNGVERHTFYANWDRDGKAAGPIRNQRMLEVGKPALVIAFPGGRGTEDMICRAENAGVPVRRATPPHTTGD